MQDKVAEWATNTYRRAVQARHHSNQVKDYLRWAKKTPEQLLKEGWDGLRDRTVARTILDYKAFLDQQRKEDPEHSKTEIAAFDSINAIRSFYKYWGLEVKFRKNEVEEPVSIYIDHRFSLAEISGMVHAGSSLRNKTIIMFASSSGLREHDIATLPRKRIEDLIKRVENGELEPPICLGPIVTEKKRVKAYPFLHSAVCKLLSEYLKTREDDWDLLFPTDQAKPCDGHYLDRMVKESYEKAGFKVPEGERIRFHCLRKFTISRMQDAGLEENVWKTIIGKKTKEAPYTTDQLREHFIKVQERLDPEAVSNNHAKMEDLSVKVERLEKENLELKVQINELAAKKGFEALMELYSKRQEAINKEAFDRSVPASHPLNGKKPVPVEPISINGSEILTLKSLAQAFQKLYDEQKQK